VSEPYSGGRYRVQCAAASASHNSISHRSIVQVQPASQTTARMVAGEEARIGLDGRVERRQRVGAVAQWRLHRLEFRTEALVDIAAEFNRYNATPQISVEGEVIRERHYSGVFDANDPESLLEFLRQDPQLLLERRSNSLVIRAPD
jgi:transmembrane sensor